MSVDGFAEEDRLIRDRFRTMWAGTPLDHVAWPNAPFTPPQGQPWVRIYTRPVDAWQADIADRPRYRHSGMLFIEAFVPLGYGEADALELLDEAAAIFRGWQTEGLRFRAPRRVPVGTVGDYHGAGIAVPYDRDTIFA